MRTALFLVSACFLASAAQAGGPVAVVEEPSPMTPTAAEAGADWTGFYLGVHATSGSIDDGTVNPDTSGYGVQAGYLRDFGAFVGGAELSYSKGDIEDLFPGFEFNATRLKLIGGYDAGRVLPYAFIGTSRYEVSLGASSNSDTLGAYGIGAKVALGATGDLRLGLEYLVEETGDFGISGAKLDGRELSLRLDYRF